MTPEEQGFFEWAFKGLVGICLTVGGWLWVMLFKAVNKNRDDLSEHKLHVSDQYAKKTDIGAVYTVVTEMQRDIKKLLARHE